MAEYDWKCGECGYTATTQKNTPPQCGCGNIMNRIYYPVSVTWGGLKPSQGEISQPIKDMIADAPKRRELHEQGVYDE